MPTRRTMGGLIWFQGIPGGSPLFPGVGEPRAKLAQGDSSRHLDRVTRGLTLPDPRPFLGEESHDPRGRGGNPWLDRGERTPASSTKIQGPRPPPSSSAGDRSDTPDPLPPVLRIQLRSSSDGDGPRSSPSPSPDLTSASKLQCPPATATASGPRTYSISSDQGLSTHYSILILLSLLVIEKKKKVNMKLLVPDVDAEWRKDLSRASDLRLAVHLVRKYLCLGHGN
ncbi:uncharacterized protein [Triticum aestivum]|uniref:uncharacterized protein n=1 Tax=Triticum aestivum TaxID=4565 RepID=UPI001D00C390|nr:uncharacterized protein LOC123106222 [Triticum aestivum]